MSAPRFHIADVDSGRSIVLSRGRVKLAAEFSQGTRFNARQARRWLKHHPTRNCVAVPIDAESGVAA